MTYLWELKSRKDLPKEEDPWEPWYETKSEFIIRAETENKARQIAHDNAGAENQNRATGTESPWLYRKYSTCSKLEYHGSEGIIYSNYNSG